MPRRLLACALLALAALTVLAQDRPAAETKRGAYVVKFAAAKDIAAVLAKHFKGAAEIQAGPDGTSNCLLVSAAPAVFDEVMKTVEKLDRRPPLVSVEVFLVELPARKADDKDDGIDPKDLEGSIADVAKALTALRRKGRVAGVRRIQLTTQEGWAANLAAGESKPYTIGRIVTYRDTGTIVRVTPQVTGDRAITLELNVQDSRMVPAEEGHPPEFTQMTLTSRVSVASGKAALAKDRKADENSKAAGMLIVVGARIADPGAKPK